MKGYRDYMNNRAVDPILHEKIMRKVTQQPMKRPVLRYAMAAACVAVLMIGIRIMPEFFSNHNGANGINLPNGYPPNGIVVGLEPPPNGNETEEFHALVFNDWVGAMGGAAISAPGRIMSDFAHDLTEEQFVAIFPTLNSSQFNARVSYRLARGDYFQGMATVFAYDFDDDSGVHIRLSQAMDAHVDGPLFSDGETYISYVHGVSVTAFIHSRYGIVGDELLSMYAVRASFTQHGIAYNVNYANVCEYSAKSRITEIVNQLIIGGAADWSVLADPVVPELRNEELTLEQARLDPDFGAFMPVNVPQGFIFDSGRRTLNQWDNSIRVNWHGYPGFDGIFWTVGEPREDELALVVSADDRHKFDVSLYPIPWFESVPDEVREYFHNPVFLAEEMTPQIVQARARWEEGRRGNDASWVIDNFSVLYGDIIIRISARGISPEQLWHMVPNY